MSCPPGAPGPYLRRHAKARNCPLGDHDGDTAYPPSVTCCKLVPSDSMVYICGSPLLPLTKAICVPVLGFQTGDTFPPLFAVTRLGFAPEASTIKISGSPRMDEENANFVPSADHAGETLVPANRGNVTTRPSSSEYIPRSTPPRAKVVNATRPLSGEMRGEREIDPSLVSCV